MNYWFSISVPLLGSIMDVRNNEENVMLHTFLNCSIIWPKIRELVRPLKLENSLNFSKLDNTWKSKFFKGLLT